MNLFLDIETIPTQRPEVRAYIEESMRDEMATALESVCAPSNYKDEQKIAEYCNVKREQIKADFAAKLDEKIKATGLDGSFGHVCCIGWALDDEPVQFVASADHEEVILREFAKSLRIGPSDRFTTTVIGHNVASFDLRFLTQRHIVNGIRPPLAIARAAQAKPWETEKVYDTMVQWAGVGQRISLDKLCLALSIESPKGDMDGSQVAEYVAAGRLEEVAAYCKRDVEATRAVWKRMTFANLGQLREAA